MGEVTGSRRSPLALFNSHVSSFILFHHALLSVSTLPLLCVIFLLPLLVSFCTVASRSLLLLMLFLSRHIEQREDEREKSTKKAKEEKT